MRTVLPTLCTSVLCAGLAAQVPPAITKTDPADNSVPPVFSDFALTNWTIPAGHPQFGSRAFPMREILQLEARPISGGLFRIAATVGGLAPIVIPNGGGNVAPGAPGYNHDLIEAIYDPAAGTVEVVFDSNTDLVSTNPIVSKQGEFALSISRDGLRCVFDYGPTSGAPHWSSRSTAATSSYAAGVSWGMPTAIANTVSTFGDSKLYYRNGQEHFAWVDANGNIQGAPIGTNGQLTAAPTQVISAIQTGAHSHNPMEDASGEVRAWIVSGRQGSGDSDAYFVPGPDDTVNAPQLIYDDIIWQANPAQLPPSGTTTWAHTSGAGGAYGTPLELSTVAVNGGAFQVAQNSTLNLRVFTPLSSAPWSMALFIGTSAAPTPIPGTLGNGLAPTPMGTRPPGMAGFGLGSFVALPGMAAPNSGGFTYQIPVAANSVVPGFPLIVQPVAFDLSNPRPFIGNTATIIGQ